MSYMRHAHTRHPSGVGLSNESMSQGRQVRSSTSYREPKITECLEERAGTQIVRDTVYL